MSKNVFFYIGRGCSRDHLGPHKTQKWPEKRAENEPKTAQDRPRSAAPRPEAYFNNVGFRCDLAWARMSILYAKTVSIP